MYAFVFGSVIAARWHPALYCTNPEGQRWKFSGDLPGCEPRLSRGENFEKESERHFEEGGMLSLLEAKTIEYKRKAYSIATDEQLARIAKVAKREFIRGRINQHTLEKICAKEPVRTTKLAQCVKAYEQGNK